MSKPWHLSYTDSIGYDSFNIRHLYRIPASECEKEQAVNFEKDGIYVADLICNQAVPGTLKGMWSYTPDSSFGYHLESDTGSASTAIPAQILLITTDSMQLNQRSDFGTPHTMYKNFSQVKTYSH